MSRNGLAEHTNGPKEPVPAERHKMGRRALRANEETCETKDALTAASGIADGVVLEQLAALEFDGDTLPALPLAPLVAVAWADGRIDGKERSAILSVAREIGLSEGDPGFRRVERWMEGAPRPELLVAWKHYVRALAARMDPDARYAMRAKFVARIWAVAAVTRGFLGVGPRVSSSELAVLLELERAFPMELEGAVSGAQ